MTGRDPAGGAHPYQRQPARAFWRQTVGARTPEAVGDWYAPRFGLADKGIATMGSCFAQHVGRHLRLAGLNHLDLEPAPSGLPPEEQGAWGYGLFSARYGNVYTSRQAVQLIQRALGRFAPAEDWWERDGGVVDPFRPTIEPEPFGSVEEMRALRRDHLERVAEVLRRMDVLVFTLGLTEAWLSRADGACFPLCPGTVAGRYDDARHVFHNLDTADLRRDLETLLALLREINPRVEILFTVSPVSLAATATEQQVAVATVYSKSVLRAAAGEICAAHAGLDYFPSYEIVTGPASRGAFLDAGLRGVTPEGVAHVMSVFLEPHRQQTVDADSGTPGGDRPLRPRPAPPPAARPAPSAEDVVCDEEILDVFGPPKEP